MWNTAIATQCAPSHCTTQCMTQGAGEASAYIPEVLGPNGPSSGSSPENADSWDMFPGSTYMEIQLVRAARKMQIPGICSREVHTLEI